MPINVAGLTDDLEALFRSPGETAVECAAAWADAMKAFAIDIVPPSTTVTSAAATLSTSLAAAFPVVASVEAAFTAFAAAVAVGMAPTFVGTPPPGPVGFSEEFAKPPSQWSATHEAAAALWAAKIDAWMRTGTATLAAPPNTPVIWS